MTKQTSPPWKKAKSEKAVKPPHLTPKKKQAAKARAKKAGRPYPNLIDNMAVSKKKKAT